MDIALIGQQEHLVGDIPEELYDIKPNQIVYFVPLEGFGLTYLDSIRDDINCIYQYLQELHKDDIDVRIVPTDNKALIDCFAGRCAHPVDVPYDVILGTKDTIAGFASHFFGEDIEKVINTPISFAIKRHFSPISTRLPAIAKIDSEDRPIRKSASIGGEFSEDFGMEMLPKRPETQKAKNEKIASQEDKIRKILWECAYLGIDIDVNKIADEVETIKSQPTDIYQLSLKMKRTNAGLIDCKVFVGKDMELNLTPIQKAVYLTFLTLGNGIVIELATPSFTQRIRNIYKSLPDKSQKEEDNGGILYATYIQSKTLRGYMSEIKDEISKLIPNGLVAIEFAIEGEKDKAFKVMRYTPEIKEQIVSAFNL